MAIKRLIYLKIILVSAVIVKIKPVRKELKKFYIAANSHQ
jgi:hypothetical protein